MKKSPLLIPLLMLLVACAGSSGKHTQYAHEAEDAGRRDAQIAIDAPANSFEREKAVLHIRVTEQKLRQAGDDISASIYADAAEAMLDSAGIIQATPKQ